MMKKVSLKPHCLRQPSPRCSPARWVAFHVLSAVLGGQELDAPEAVRRSAAALGLSAPDRRLAFAIVLTVLRHLLTLDYQIQQRLHAKKSSTDPSILNLFRMISAQRHFLDRVPSYAAVSDAVEIGKALHLSAGAIRFLNAVGRALASQENLNYPSTGDPAYDLSVRWSQPRWLVQAFLDTYGQPSTLKLLSWLNEEPRATVRVNILRTTPSELASCWAADGIFSHPSDIVPTALILNSPQDFANALAHWTFQQGSFYVQDEASQLVSLALDPRPGEQVLDLCAAPGGKTTHLAELACGRATIHATDRDTKRLELLQENLARLQTPGVEIRPYEEICLLAHNKAQCYDAVLVDAPCSALGTVRRHPEVRWRATLASLASFAETQRDLLMLAAQLVRPGGRIVYATCSPLRSENHEVVAHFLASHEDFMLAMPERLGNLFPSVAGQVFSTWPEWPELDGFCLTVLRRRADSK
ncbi:MAG: 16S rRNA (cytosine(967)-C(5))-methyltransferase RsmB [Candidatus Sumerlaeaceae bacterium]